MMAKNETLIMAGIIAATRWNIDPAKVNVKIVNSLEPFKVRLDSKREWAIGEAEAFVNLPPSDDMIFENYNGKQWRLNGFEFWLAWGPITKTLAIYIRSMALAGETVRV